MKPTQTLLTVLALTLPLAGATAQQWTTNTLPPGLIAWWQAEGSMLDSAGVHHGSGSALPSYAPGRFGQAFQFNGTDQSVSVPDIHPDLDSWTQFTLEAWVYLDNRMDGTGGGQAILSKVGDGRQPGPDLGYQFGFGQGATKLFCQFNSSGQPWPGYQTIAVLSEPAPTSTWLHVAATYDQNAVKIYFNGVCLVTNVIGPATIVNCDASLRLNSDDNENVYFAGRIDDARIYHRALSAAEIAYLFQGPTPPVTQGLKFHLDANDVNAGSNPADSAPVTTWRDLSGLGLDATPLFGVAPVYRTSALNGRAGVDFSLSGSDSLATAFSSQLNFTNCTIFMVGNGAGTPTHVSISAPAVAQEFILGDKAIYHHASAYHWTNRSHQDSPTGYYIQAGLFGTKSNELANCINRIFSTSPLALGQQPGVADYVPVARQAILGWRNSDANGNLPVAGENFGGVLCEVLVYDRQLSGAEVDAMNFFLSAKYGLPVMPIPPVLQVAFVTSGTLGLQWSSTAGRRYQLQSATNLPAATWLNEGPPFPGTGGVLSTNVPIGPDPNKFFRLLDHN